VTILAMVLVTKGKHVQSEVGLLGGESLSHAGLALAYNIHGPFNPLLQCDQMFKSDQNITHDLFSEPLSAPPTLHGGLINEASGGHPHRIDPKYSLCDPTGNPVSPRVAFVANNCMVYSGELMESLISLQNDGKLVKGSQVVGAVRAVRDIKAGEELFWSYGESAVRPRDYQFTTYTHPRQPMRVRSMLLQGRYSRPYDKHQATTQCPDDLNECFFPDPPHWVICSYVHARVECVSFALLSVYTHAF
jgi:hypothetical protein